MSNRAMQSAFEQGKGILRLTPTWVPRSFCIPGRRIKLHPDDYYVLGGERDDVRDEVVLQFDQSFYGTPRPYETFRSIVTKRWMYSRFIADGESHLFDLEADPYQLDNLIDDPTHAGTVRELDGRLVARLEEIGDPIVDTDAWRKPVKEKEIR